MIWGLLVTLGLSTISKKGEKMSEFVLTVLWPARHGQIYSQIVMKYLSRQWYVLRSDASSTDPAVVVAVVYACQYDRLHKAQPRVVVRQPRARHLLRLQPVLPVGQAADAWRAVMLLALLAIVLV